MSANTAACITSGTRGMTMNGQEAGQRLMEDLWAMPPRGVTFSTVRMRQADLTQWTYLCEKNDNCFSMAHSIESEEHARSQVAGHVCPAPPRRGVNPTGQTLLEKTWNELDDAIDAIKSGSGLRDMSLEETKGYAKGFAECLTFFATPYFKIPEDVLRQANKRWRMRQGLEPFSPTPSYRWNPIIDEYRNKSIQGDKGFASKPDLSPGGVKKAARGRLVTRPAAGLTKPAPREFSVAEAEMVASSLHSGNMTADTLAEMFGVSISRILTVAGPAPGTDTSDEELMSAFVID